MVEGTAIKRCWYAVEINDKVDDSSLPPDFVVDVADGDGNGDDDNDDGAGFVCDSTTKTDMAQKLSALTGRL